MTPASPASVPQASKVPAASQPMRADRARARLLAQDLGAVIDPHQQDRAVGIADRDHLLLRMAGDARRRAPQRPRTSSAACPSGRPCPGTARARAARSPRSRATCRPRSSRTSARAPNSRTSACACYRRAPAMQRRLLHRGDQELAVGAEGDVMVRALPLQQLAAPTGRSETTATRRCSGRPRAGRPSAQTPARRRSRAPRCVFGSPLPAITKADLPADQAIAPSGPVATWSIQRRLASVATSLLSPVGAGDEHLAVVAAGDDPDAVARGREDAAAVDGKPLLVALGRDQQELLFAQHEGRGVVDEIRSDHRRARGDRPGAFDDGRGVGWSVSHSQLSPAVIPGRAEAREPGIQAQRCLALDSGLAASRRPGMTAEQTQATQLSKPLRIFSSGNLRPMNTSRLSRFSPSFQGRW